jgi:alginate O-acetyltransferase complex protein AlgI
MLFVESKFFVFFAIVFCAYWALKQNGARKWLILVASYFFYGSWDWRFALMLFGISTADYLFALKIDASDEPKTRRTFVCLSLAMNLSVLAFFKYFNFFVGSSLAMARAFGVTPSFVTVHIILPIGVSFFTFQSLSYTIDVYRKEIPPARSWLDYLVFSSFFPQLVAGPIVRPSYFLPQLASPRTLSRLEIKACLCLFLIGFFKKCCLADNVSVFADHVFAAPLQFNQVSNLEAVWLYAVQIYCDFSGYSDMAIAVAGLLGFQLVVNFDAPYLSTSIQDFWRRWHISLSTWIRDYIYLSLGGRQPVRLLTYRNLLLTMLAGGLWHGASWTFVAWGGAHGVALVVQREFRHRTKTLNLAGWWVRPLGWFLTINFVCVSWILFRAKDFQTAGQVLKNCIGVGRPGMLSLPLWLLAFPAVLLVFEWAGKRTGAGEKFRNLRMIPFGLCYGACWAITLSLLPLGAKPFIYFQF